MTVVVEVGPVTVRRIGGLPDDRGPDDRVPAALDGIDDAVVLVDERPVNGDELWRDLLGDFGSDDLVVVHPSWWPRYRIERISSAAPAGARCVHRCDAFVERLGGPITVVEVDRDLVAVIDGEASLSVHDRNDVDGIAAAVAPSSEVAFDAPAGVDGGVIRQALIDRGIAVREVDLAGVYATDRTPARTSRRRRPVLVSAVAALAATAVIAGVLSSRPERHPVPASGTVALVEGRVAVTVPAQWTVQRITGGPGSRRVQVTAPGDSGAALHITAAYVPESTLGAAAEVLGRAAAAQPPGVFTDVRAGVMAGRDVLTYQESRPGRLIRWTVLIDGATRIAVGCQSEAETARQACEQAIRSAHEVTGTAPAR